MNFKYYDLLSNLIVGVVAVFALWKMFLPEVVVCDWLILPMGYVLGYFLDAIASLLEPILFKTICGKPSDILLTPVSGKDWTGINKVRFYYPRKAIDALRKDIGDDNASSDKMFDYAKGLVSGNTDGRVPDFRGHYALSRVVLITALIAVIVVEMKYYDVWYSWIFSILALFLSWNRYRERGYYYSREVLNEYLKTK